MAGRELTALGGSYSCLGRIQPDEGISLSFSGKIPGPDVDLRSVEMDFCYQNAFGGRSPEAYETLLLDCLLGDGTLFADAGWIEMSWELLMPVLEAWNKSSDQKHELAMLHAQVPKLMAQYKCKLFGLH